MSNAKVKRMMPYVILLFSMLLCSSVKASDPVEKVSLLCRDLEKPGLTMTMTLFPKVKAVKLEFNMVFLPPETMFYKDGETQSICWECGLIGIMMGGKSVGKHSVVFNDDAIYFTGDYIDDGSYNVLDTQTGRLDFSSRHPVDSYACRSQSPRR